MTRLVIAAAAVLILVALLPNHAAADSIRIRALLDDEGDILIQRDYTGRGWVTVNSITLGEPEAGVVFQHGSTTLAIEFIPWARMPHSKNGGMTTRAVPSGESDCEGGAVEWDDAGEPTRWQYTCTNRMNHLLSVSCEWGWEASLGPFTSLGSALEVGFYALDVCKHGRLLQGLPGGSQSLKTLRANIAATLAANGETRPLEEIPEEATQANPLRSETTYVDIRVLKVAGSDEEPTITVQAHGGGSLQDLQLGTPITVGIFSLKN